MIHLSTHPELGLHKQNNGRTGCVRLGERKVKRGETRGRTREEQEANAGSFVHTAGYFYGNIAAPFVFRLSEPQQSIDIRSILEATARIEIYGLEGSGALLLFRRE